MIVVDVDLSCRIFPAPLEVNKTSTKHRLFHTANSYFTLVRVKIIYFFSTRTGNTNGASETEVNRKDVTRLEKAKILIQKSMEMASDTFKTVPIPKAADVDSNPVNEGNVDNNTE